MTVPAVIVSASAISLFLRPRAYMVHDFFFAWRQSGSRAAIEAEPITWSEIELSIHTLPLPTERRHSRTDLTGSVFIRIPRAPSCSARKQSTLRQVVHPPGNRLAPRRNALDVRDELKDHLQPGGLIRTRSISGRRSTAPCRVSLSEVEEPAYSRSSQDERILLSPSRTIGLRFTSKYGQTLQAHPLGDQPTRGTGAPQFQSS